MTRSLRRLLLLATFFAAFGCGPQPAKTPAEAHARLAVAVAAHDATRLWKALDEETRSSWIAIGHAWREAYDITQSVVPEGPERARLLERFGAGATPEDAGTLFKRTLAPDEWKQEEDVLAAASGRQPETTPAGETAELATPAGSLVYRRTHDQPWRWGYSGFAARAEQIKRTATADLARMRADAAAYRRAAPH